MEKIIIGYDAKRIVRNATGLGNYCRTLVNDLAAVVPSDWQLRLYAPDRGRDDLRSQVPERPNLTYAFPQRGGLMGAFWRLRTIVRDLQRDGVQLYHGLTGELPWGLRRAGIPSVVTIHDLIFLRHPEYYHWLDTKIYAWKFRHVCREADRIIAISERTKQDIIELGGVSSDRIDVIYQSCSPRYHTPPSPVPRPTSPVQLPPSNVQRPTSNVQRPTFNVQRSRYLLSVGTLEERKNILLAVRALRYLPGDLHLVAVGRSTEYAERVLEEASRDGLAPRVHFLHGVSDADLQALYQSAEVFVYPSRYEGFGIPIIEAIHSGLPVVAATGSCLEEAGGPDSLYVSPDDPEALAAAVSRVLRGAPEREARIVRSRDYVRRFEGSDVAAQVLDIYRQLLESKLQGLR